MFPKHPRLQRRQYLGRQRYLLTFCCNYRHAYFVDAELVREVCDQILRTAARERVAVVAYCFMPDHVHLAVEGTDDATDLTRFVKLAKQHTGYTFKQQHGVPLWQPGWYDRIIRPSDDFVSVVRYLLDNPVRAGLAPRADAYPYSGSATMPLETLLGSAGL